MKKYILTLLFVIPFIFVSCDYMSNFNGLDELVTSTETTTYQYKVVDADFATIVSELRKNKNKSDSLAATALNAAKIFSLDYPASQYVPYLLKTKFAGATKGSAAKVTYAINDTTLVENIDKYTLVDDDYTSMGTEINTPGQYKNFSNLIDPNFYLPLWLKTKYPYAKQGTMKLIRYKYYQSPNTSVIAKVFLLNDGNWLPLTKTEQFVFAGWENNGWVFDPTIRITMKKGKEPTDDFMLVVNYVKEHFPELVNSYGDTEYRYGFAAFYGNISYREKDRLNDPDYEELGDDKDAKLALCEERTKEGLAIFLMLKIPDTPLEVSGINVHCLVTTLIYDGVTYTTYVYDMKRSDTSEFKWEYVSREKL